MDVRTKPVTRAPNTFWGTTGRTKNALEAISRHLDALFSRLQHADILSFFKVKLKSLIDLNDWALDFHIFRGSLYCSCHFSALRQSRGNISAKCWFWVEYLIQEFWILWITRTTIMCMAIIHLLYALSNRQPIKKRLMFLPGYGSIGIADWSIIVQCHLLVKHGF
jgi:hypothetical protein